jgi:hypothetical protein
MKGCAVRQKTPASEEAGYSKSSRSGLYGNVVVGDGAALAADGLDAQDFEMAVVQIRHIFLHRLMEIVFELRGSNGSGQEARVDAVGGDLAGGPIEG